MKFGGIWARFFRVGRFWRLSDLGFTVYGLCNLSKGVIEGPNSLLTFLTFYDAFYIYSRVPSAFFWLALRTVTFWASV